MENKMKRIIPIILLSTKLALALPTEGLMPNASVTEDDAVQIQYIIDQIYKIERPNDAYLGGQADSAPAPIDTGAPNYLELVKYGMVTALIERADRENYWGDVDEKAGYPRRFGATKARDYYVNIFLRQWELEQVQNSFDALRAVKSVEPSCPDGFEVWGTGTGICNKWSSHFICENNFDSCSLNNYQLRVENAELKRQLMMKDIPNFADGAGRGRLWKPEADPKARCKGGTTILLESGNSTKSIDILDSSFKKIKTPSNFGQLSDGRPRFCAVNRPGASFGSGPIFIQVGEKIFRVNNPANRED